MNRQSSLKGNFSSFLIIKKDVRFIAPVAENAIEFSCCHFSGRINP